MRTYDPKAHSTNRGVSREDYRVLPDRIFLVRHGESDGNLDATVYSGVPDHKVQLSEKGQQQAIAAGQRIKQVLEEDCAGSAYKVFFITSPYVRSFQTYEGVRSVFDDSHVLGMREEVQLREQDFGNFQNPDRMACDQDERRKFGRFYYRFPNGESGADVYDRVTLFMDHVVRDMNAGRFAGANLVLLTHGLTLRIFLMRWFHWSVDQYHQVYNPPNAEPIWLEKMPYNEVRDFCGNIYRHTKELYLLTSRSQDILRGVSTDMCGATTEEELLRWTQEWYDTEQAIGG